MSDKIEKLSTAVLVAEHPLPFCGEMVNATYAGLKTMTRRVITLPGRTPRARDTSWINAIHPDGGGNWIGWDSERPGLAEFTKKAYPAGEGFRCRYGKVGDRLWVRESYAKIYVGDGCLHEEEDFHCPCEGCRIEYRADTTEKYPGGWPEETRDDPERPKWKPGMFMPRWASRLTLEILALRPERLQCITAEDILAEGIRGRGDESPEQLRALFVALWNGLNAKRGYPFELNPWVWAITFPPHAEAERKNSSVIRPVKR